MPELVGKVQTLWPPLSLMPWRQVVRPALAGLERRFKRLLDRADPARTVAYFWPGASLDVVRYAREHGILTVREMINSFQGTAKLAIDRAYDRAGLPNSYRISKETIEEEVRELALYDYVCASNRPVEESLEEAGVARHRIIQTSFGWSPQRFEEERPAELDLPTEGIRILFAGSIGVRKGVPELLEAWARVGIKGHLILVGNVEPGMAHLIENAVASGTVRVVPFTPNIGAYYRACDIFVFPTHEEGGPQVTIEAGGCGMPIITTPMGAARLVRHGETGLVVRAGKREALAAAIERLGKDAELRMKLGRKAAEEAKALTYDRLGAQRALAFLERLEAHRRRSDPRAGMKAGDHEGPRLTSQRSGVAQA